ncbi:MAG: site-specific DNA-methyltransferase, partial [Planctomycetia bacterium]|nr:site-specific DNA-methyltransferase [Planctomycetia bacterium]
MSEPLDGRSMDVEAANREKLRAVFPECFSDGRLDMDRLRSLCGEYIDDDFEKYEFKWKGKSKCLRLAQKRSTATLRPCPAESVHFDTTQNLYLEGDNLEVLKLLQKSYFHKVKVIYIDPPYNTGNHFVYEDDFTDPLARYREITQQTTQSHPETMGRYHTNWLNMMYPRLRLAANLLRDDGAIFITIDDNEVFNLKKVCDEIFGEENFMADVIWQHSIQPKGYLGKFSVHHNHILCYSKSKAFELGSFARTEEDNKAYSNPDNDPNGPWRSGDVRNALYRPNLIYDIISPSGKVIQPCEKGWRWSKETVAKKIQSGEIIFNGDETRIIRKIYLKNLEGRTPETIWFGKEAGTTR